MSKSAVIIQARMSSKRFPSKMMSLLAGIPLVEYVYRRCQYSSVKNVLIATSKDKSDDIIYGHCKNYNISVFRGDLDNVLHRYIQAGDFLKVDYIVRVCGDTPFVDISLIDALLQRLIHERLDYMSMNRQTCAAAFYSEAVTLQALKKAEKLTSNNEDLEHVTKYIICSNEKFLTKFIDVNLNPEFIRKLRLTIDQPEDIQRANTIINALTDKFSFTSQDVLRIIGQGFIRQEAVRQ